ncbi:MAG TPA: SgcJ/EcaC family oxidoreductase [Rhodothermales bacterium]|nr:SgcJ/EcaC family oxidoreductase [Rhodothermales bacterium]
MPNDRESIERRRQEWITAVNARDVDGYLELLTGDVVWIPPGQSAVSGKQAFASWVRPFFERFNYEFVITEPELQLAGNWAVERGAFETKMTSLNDGQTGQHAGAYLVLWRKQGDGVWRIERYVDDTGPAAARSRDG